MNPSRKKKIKRIIIREGLIILVIIILSLIITYFGDYLNRHSKEKETNASEVANKAMKNQVLTDKEVGIFYNYDKMPNLSEVITRAVSMCSSDTDTLMPVGNKFYL